VRWIVVILGAEPTAGTGCSLEISLSAFPEPFPMED